MEKYYRARKDEIEKELNDLEEFYENYSKNKKLIKIGSLIFDKETESIMVVTGLKNGINDFEAKYRDDDKLQGRGYHYDVENWVFLK